MTNTPRGPYAKGVAKRQEILDAALEAYGESDSGTPSLKHIAARVGLSEKGLTHYFASRDELLIAVLAARDEADAITESAPGDLREAAGSMISHNAGTPGLVRLFVEMAASSVDPDHAAHAFFIARTARLQTALQQALAEATGTPVAENASKARLLLAAADGLQVQWLRDRSIDMRAELNFLYESLTATRGC